MCRSTSIISGRRFFFSTGRRCDLSAIRFAFIDSSSRLLSMTIERCGMSFFTMSSAMTGVSKYTLSRKQCSLKNLVVSRCVSTATGALSENSLSRLKATYCTATRSSLPAWSRSSSSRKSCMLGSTTPAKRVVQPLSPSAFDRKVK